jgi:hypothetical protein
MRLLLVCASPLLAQLTLDAPRIGCVAGDDGVRIMWGVPGSFILGAPWLQAARQAACGDRLAVVRAGNEVSIFGLPEGKMVASQQVGSDVVISVARDGAGFWEPGHLRLWSGTWHHLEVPGDWLTFAIAPGQVIAVVRERNGTWLRWLATASGAVRREISLPGKIQGAHVWPGATLLLSRPGAVTVRRPAGEEDSLPIVVEQFLPVSEDWVQARGPEGSFALHLGQGKVNWFHMPEAVP